tara:strand:- start:1785 stop:3368 length:1584 start_codon:yes stop_codon:yes gene_type:complete
MEPPRALISVWHKEGVEELSQALSAMGWQILSTGGTARKLRSVGIKVLDVSEATGHPEVFDGRVKTLHPAVHGGILARRDKSEDMDTLNALGYGPIDLVCVNLYPFVETAARRPPATDSELIEMIDIGGPTMIRSAAKNHKDVIVLTSPSQYEGIIAKLREAEGDPSAIGIKERAKLALESFKGTAAYDTAVSNELESRLKNEKIPSMINIATEIGSNLRYGENPHQPASFYPNGGEPSGLAAAIQHGGKPLSYNNYLDLDGALRLAQNIIHSCPNHNHGCVVIKHTNPCGAAVDSSQSEAWKSALASDPESAFGCVIAFTKEVELDTAIAIGDHFFECMIAPGYHPEALAVLSSKKNRRMLTLRMMGPRKETLSTRQVNGGWLAQIQGTPPIDWQNAECVTERKMGEKDISLARFGCAVLSEVKSNAIILVSETATGLATVGVGPGQTSRVEAVRIASRRAGDRAKGSMMVSDAFFPFRDGIDSANDIGVSSVVQPGGSVRDQESIDAANEYGISMLFTGTRMFLH